MEVNREPQPGDIIWADRSPLPYNHCGIYEGAGRVIHFASQEGSEINQENAVVHETSFEHFKDGCPVKVIKLENCKYNAEETLRRARECIGDKGYDFFTNNCDHFATWCRTGVKHSLQVDKVKAILRDLDNPITDVICEMHDMAETLKTASLNTEKENEIEESLDANTYITEPVPPAADNENDIQPDIEIIDDPYPKEDEADTGEDDGNKEELPPAKKAWYEKVGNGLKFLTYPISGALEIVKRKLKPPFLKNIDFLHIGAKVRNGIDNVVNAIKVATGRMTPQEAYDERMNNETALAGYIIAQKQKQPVRETLKHVFGKVGSTVKHVVQQAVTRTVPAPVRTVIKAGFKKIGTAFVSKVKSIVNTTKTVVKAAFGKVANFFRRRG